MKRIFLAMWALEILLYTFAYSASNPSLPVHTMLWAAIINGSAITFVWIVGYAMGMRFPFREEGPPTGRHLFLGVVAVVVLLPPLHAAEYVLLHIGRILDRSEVLAARFDHFWSAVFSWTPASLLIVASSLAAGHVLAYYEGYRQRDRAALSLERRLIEARAHALKMQLQPHFLFNTLNAVSGLATTNAEAARTLLQRLRKLLDVVLRMRDVQQVTVAEEIEVLEQYIGIQDIRFGERIRTVLYVDEAIRTAVVPHLVLQPLVENAFSHGASAARGKRFVSVIATAWDDELKLIVRDDGLGLRNHSVEGVGLHSTRNRLETLYGQDYTFAIRNMPSGGCEVAITLPLVVAS